MSDFELTNANCPHSRLRLSVEDERIKSIHAYRIDSLHRHLQLYLHKVCAVERVIWGPFFLFFLQPCEIHFSVLCKVNLNTEKLCCWRKLLPFLSYRHLFQDIHATAKQIYFLFPITLLFNLTLKHSWITIQLLNRNLLLNWILDRYWLLHVFDESAQEFIYFAKPDLLICQRWNSRAYGVSIYSFSWDFV